MHHTQVIKSIMSDTGTTQKDLVPLTGVKSQSVISERINYKTIGLKPLLEILGAMGYELVVRKSTGEEGFAEYRMGIEDYKD